MKRFFSLFCSAFFVFFSIDRAFASVPFSDIPEGGPLYDAIDNLYEAKIISDDGSHLFRPNDPMSRDFFVSLITMMGCKYCLTPSYEDIIKYKKSPFVDLSKTHPYYYCIAHSHEKNIVQGYIPDAQGNISCNNGKTYHNVTPFCGENHITRIEAAAMLLRRANLWSDILNAGNFSRSQVITDVNKYWYGYAKKAIEIGIINKKSDNSVSPNEPITRGEFARMSAKILEYSQCNFDSFSKNNTVSGYIEITDWSQNPIPRTIFTSGEQYFFHPKTEPWEWKYSWTAMDDDGNAIHGKGGRFSGQGIPPGKWRIIVEIIDPKTNTPVSSPNITVTVIPKQSPPNLDTDGDGIFDREDRCPKVPGVRENAGCPLWYTLPSMWVKLIAEPSVTHIWNPILFTPYFQGTGKNYDYKWDFADGNHINWPGNKTHPYEKEGTYAVILTVTDRDTGEVAQARAIVRITDNRDTDGDEIWDKEDKCPTVRGKKENTWCPDIGYYDYGCITRDIYGNTTHCLSGGPGVIREDVDGDGVPNSEDRCLRIHGSRENFGCPPNNSYEKSDNNEGGGNDDDADGDGIINRFDRCPRLPGVKEFFGCPPSTTTDTDGDGVLDPNDACVVIPGPASNQWCPISATDTDTDGDSVPDNWDRCVQIFWNPDWNGCPTPSVLRFISPNVCLVNKINTEGLLTGTPECNACPCQNSVNITANIRSCDVLFPTILSPDKNTVYSRGAFYLLP